jgi:predicted nucleic acid-binding Zn ribbon protein
VVFIKAGDLISKFIRRSSNPQLVFAVWIRRLWKEAVLEVFPKFTPPKAKFFRGGKLTIEVKSSAEAGEFRLHEEELIKKINSKAGKKVVEKLNFKMRF